MSKNSKRYLSALSLAMVLTVPTVALAEEPASTSTTTVWTNRAQDINKRYENADERRKEFQNEKEAKWADRKDEITGDKQAVFCSRFTNLATEMESRMKERSTHWDEWVSDRKNERNTRHDERDAEIAKERADQDVRRAELYAKLDEKADTDEEKAAVAEFKSTMDAAVATRRAAVDAAIKSFRDAVAPLALDMQSGAEDGYAEFKAAVEAAVAKAEADCESEQNPGTVYSNFQAAMNEARKNLNDDRNGITGDLSGIEGLADARAKAIEDAIADFKETAEAAKEKLKAAMGQDVTP